MPSKSAKQARTMRAVAHNPEFAKKVGIPVDVAKEFTAADKDKRFKGGGRPDLQKVNRSETQHGEMAFFSKGGAMAKKMAKGGIAASGMGKVVTGGKRPHGEHTVQQKGHTKAKSFPMAGNKGLCKGGKVK